ncbi:glycosyltransferase family 2 protein [Methylocystis sp. FS]|uniref:glycosyltransferase family 2 protein n=1 Tax=Methylocystis silviterrae TaxID=2743612 RepID=UPI001581DF26|nr:glycosyltransferase family A protein [Methylocystis silviterrae]NUJ79153.1 glycosyltransferase family 2 protein [Methylocystis silviterrae]
MKTPRFSIVIPCYNCSSTIVETLKSASAQTIRDIEIIVIDDGSTDESAEIVARYAQSEPRLRLVRQANAGVSASRNRGMTEARGSLIAFLDSDDLWDPRYLETHSQRFEADPSLGLSFSVARIMRADGQDTGQISRPKLHDLTPAEMLATNPCTTTSAIVVRRATLDEAGLFDTSLRRAEDQEWLFRVALTKWKIEGDAEPLVSYRQSVGGLSSNLPAMYDSFEEMLAKARRLNPALVDQHGKIASARMLRYLARRALRVDHSRARAQHYVIRALREGPAIILLEPKQTLATLIAAFVPGCDYLFNIMRKA